MDILSLRNYLDFFQLSFIELLECFPSCFVNQYYDSIFLNPDFKNLKECLSLIFASTSVDFLMIYHLILKGIQFLSCN